MTRMTHTGRTIAIVTVAAAATMAMSGCAWLAPPERFSDEATLDEQVQSIEIEHPEGSVTVEGIEGATSVSVSRTVSYRGDREIGSTFEVQGDVLVLGGCGRNCSVDYTVEVPVGVDVGGATSNGEIALTGVNEVEVKTSNGRIEGRGLAGDGVRASTSNGAIELRLAAPQDVEAHTSNGRVDIAVPTGAASYQVETDTSNGRVDVDIDDDVDGEFLLDLSTSNGSITVSGR